MPNRWSWLALGAGAYLAFVVWSFPAGTAYAWFAPPEVKLSGVEGTIWSGRAAAGSVANLAVHDIRWRVSGWQLLIGRIAGEIDVRLSEGFLNAHVAATPIRIALSDVRASASLATLRAVLPISGMQGLANVALTRLEIRDGQITSVVGELRLAQLEVAPFVPSAARRLVLLGDYAVQFLDSSAGGVNASFKDTGGPLEVSGTLVVDGARAYTLDGLIKPRADASQELLDGLNVVTADPDAEGRRRLTLTGSL